MKLMTREGGFFWKSISLNNIFSSWKPKISFTEMFRESTEKQFNWNLMLRHTVKSTLISISWNNLKEKFYSVSSF